MTHADCWARCLPPGANAPYVDARRISQVSVWIKICGLTSIEAVQAAVESKVDAVGFVFAPSKRQVLPSRAAELARVVPPHIAKVAVMLHPTQQAVDEVLSQFQPDLLQTDAADFDSLS